VGQNNNSDFSTLPNAVIADHRSVIVEDRAEGPSCNSEISREREILSIDQPQFNHNGGDLVFGPDNNLFISLGVVFNHLVV